ncbi:MAG: glycosyltransferase family 39 protein, partial [Patescibacteria group bacterium]
MNYDLRFKNFIIFGIIILAAILRFWRLDSYPALNADEAAIGYNAYSLIQTGKDEHGNAWPIHFQSFSDYKPGLYFYLVLPFVKVLGLNEWAVRIPGATLGVLTVLALYFLVKELEIARPERGRRGNWKLRIIASLFLAISPWHIHFSRGGWEVNSATFFITAGLLFFVKATKKQRLSNFAFCILNFAFAMYAYHAARIIVPLLSLGLVIIYREQIFKNLKPFIISGAIGILLLL